VRKEEGTIPKRSMLEVTEEMLGAIEDEVLTYLEGEQKRRAK